MESTLIMTLYIENVHESKTKKVSSLTSYNFSSYMGVLIGKKLMVKFIRKKRLTIHVSYTLQVRNMKAVMNNHILK